ncbi:NAD-dependent epimerase/dehydratase family protein [Amycolatopsis sp. FBCC-B4732]|uniref:NAD-dependent epimerase/dehydratase family protein n=1 Tax=Amycolatopsis sp. FBCC-B4732 TaxID=3079339 RepID=UPI001FF2B3EA|nr:NAD-dependent epimerase/dehydratase family protein [Amycolatopsis sp. FBCC-B4732]UOX89482.1 NAD-dependent epimerase/dehydratase family protein [Amycolatopsis sp. FBCC-B4732]
MLIAVTGGTGFLGGHTVAALLRRGHRVRLLARDAGRAPSTVDVVDGDVTDPGAAARLVDGADALLHAAGVYTFDSRRRAEVRRVNVGGTANVLDAARRAGTGRIVHVSTVGALYPAREPSIGPASPVGRPRETYLAAKAEAELIARAHRDAGAPVTITYPPALLGPADPHLGDQNARLRDLLRGLMPMWPSGGLPIGDVRDSAELHARLFEPAAPGPAYFGPGHFLRTRDYLAAVRAATGRRLPAVFLPARAMFPVGHAAGLLQRAWPWHIPAEYGALYVCATAVPVDAAAPHAGVPARPVAQTVRDTVAWLHASGRLTRRQAGTVLLPRVSTVDAGVGAPTEEVLP